MSPIRNSGRVPTPAPYQPKSLYDPNFDLPVAIDAFPSPYDFYRNRRAFADSPSGRSTPPSLSAASSPYPSPARSVTALSTPSSSAPSPAISNSSVSDFSSPLIRLPVLPPLGKETAPSHSRRKPESHVRRPPNPFIIFRSAFWNAHKKTSCTKDHRQISKMAGEAWNNLTPEEQAPYRQRAYEAKLQHQEEHPDYRYAPIGRKCSPVRKVEMKLKEDEAMEGRCMAITGFLRSGLKGKELEDAIYQLQPPNPSPAPIGDTEAWLRTLPQLPLGLPVHRASPAPLFPEVSASLPPTPAIVAPPIVAEDPTSIPPVPVFDSLYQPCSLNPLLSDVPAAPSTEPESTSEADARILWELLSNFNGGYADVYGPDHAPSLSSSSSSSSANQDYHDIVSPFSSVFPTATNAAADTGFQGALGFQPYYDLAYPAVPTDVASATEEAQVVAPATDATKIVTSEEEQQPSDPHNFDHWLNADSF